MKQTPTWKRAILWVLAILWATMLILGLAGMVWIVYN